MSVVQHVADPFNPSTPPQKPLRSTLNYNITPSSSTPSSPLSLSGSEAGQNSDNTPTKQTLGRETGRLKRQATGKVVVQYQSLEQLLAQAGYAETRVITPESVRIKERAAWIQAQEEEEERQERTEAQAARDVSEIERILFEDHFASSTVATGQDNVSPGRNTSLIKSLSKSGSGSGLRSHSLGQEGDGRGEQEEGKVKKPWSTFDSMVNNHQYHQQQRHHLQHHRSSKDWDSSSDAIVYHYPANTFSLDDHTTTGRMSTVVPSSRDIQNHHYDKDNNCHNEEECGSLSSSLSTFSAADTIILSPPDLNIQAFENESASEDDDDDDRRFHPTWSVPLNESVEDLRMSQASSRTIRPSNRSFHRSQSTLTLPNSGPAKQAPKDTASGFTEDESSFASSEAARSLRRISSLAQLSSKNPPASTLIKPKFLNAFTFFSSVLPSSNNINSKRPNPSPRSIPPDQAQDTLLKRTLRHTASTPVLAQRAGPSKSTSEDIPPLPAGWLETIRNTLQPTVTASSSSVSTLKLKGASPLPRQSSSPAVLSPPLSSSDNMANVKTISVHLRSAPLIPQMTPSTVVCDSEEGEDLPPFSSLSVFNQFSGSSSTSTSSLIVPQGPISEPVSSPVLTPKISFGEGEGWSRTTCPGWVWTEGTDDREEDGWYASPTCSFEDSPLENSSPPRPRATTISSSSSSSNVFSTSTASATSATAGGSRPGTLRAQRSIKSLRETLAADSTAQATALARAKAQAEAKAKAAAAAAAVAATNQAFKFKTPNRRPKKASSPMSIRYRDGPVPIFCISSPDTLELGLPPRELNVEEEERRASALVASALSASRRESDESWSGGRRRLEKKERKVKRGIARRK